MILAFIFDLPSSGSVNLGEKMVTLLESGINYDKLSSMTCLYRTKTQSTGMVDLPFLASVAITTLFPVPEQNIKGDSFPNSMIVKKFQNLWFLVIRMVI